jgi:hypothetical protein
MKKVSLIFGVITIVGIGYGVKRATSQQPVPIASDPSPSRLLMQLERLDSQDSMDIR